MTLKRRIYFRKKAENYVWEGKIKGSTEFLLQKPKDDGKFLMQLGRIILSLSPEQQKIAKSSFFNKDKWLLILEKINRLDLKIEKSEKDAL